MCALRSAVSANFLAASVAAIASGVIGLAMKFSKLVNAVFSQELGVVDGAAQRKIFCCEAVAQIFCDQE
jgi:hypothetical protein